MLGVGGIIGSGIFVLIAEAAQKAGPGMILSFVVAGVVRFVAALGEPEGRGGNIAIALLDLVAGIVILSWPGPSLATLAVIIGIVLVLRGALLIGAGWELHGLGREVDGELQARAAT